MIVKLFKPEFEQAIVSGRKTSTIRPIPRGRPPLVGQVISLRLWTGKPYRSKQREIKRAIVTAVGWVFIGFNAVQVGEYDFGDRRVLRPTWLREKQEHDLAVKDGFKSVDDLRNWFERVHGLPFQGIRIVWQP